MKIIYEYTNVSRSERLESIAEKKLTSLSTKYPDVIRADVFFKMENTGDDSGKQCGIRLSVPGPRIFASSSLDSFESAITKAVHDLSAQLEKKKDSVRIKQM